MAISLDSSDSEDSEEVNARQITHVTHPGCRPNLYVSRTTLYSQPGERLDEMGIFTSVPLQPGQFVGLYNGTWWDMDAYQSIPNPRRASLDRYSIGTSGDQDGEIVVSPPLVNGQPSPAAHPLAMANEPQQLSSANCVLVEFNFLLDEVDVDPNSVPEERQDDEYCAVGLVVCRPVGSNRELLWHYGRNYPRPTWSAGKACRAPRRNRWEDPLVVLGRIPPDCCSLDVRQGPVYASAAQTRSSRSATRGEGEQRAALLRAFTTANIRSLHVAEARRHLIQMPPPLRDVATLYRLDGVFTPSLCARVIDEAERVGFAQSPHLAANTVLQLSVNRSVELMTITHSLVERMRPFMRKQYDVEVVEWREATSLQQFKRCCNDCFVSKYIANTNYSGISLHRDGEDFAFVVQLNSSASFEGGGTHYPHFECTWRLEQGDMGVHPGFVLHGGAPITGGTRYILAGFLKVEERAPSGRALHPLRTVDAKARQVETALQVSPEADVELAKLFVGGV